MNFTDLRKRLMWFTLIFFTIIIPVAWLYCKCLPWLLFVTIYVFCIFYILISFGSKKVLDRLHINPFAYLFLSFIFKVVLVAGFAFLLIEYFNIDRRTILLLLVTGYLIAAIFDFILLVNMNQIKKP